MTDDQLSVSHNNNQLLGSPEWLRKQGVPDTAIDAARAADRTTLVKAECRRRIYRVASAESQMNMAAAASVIAAKTASARSSEENDVLARIEATTAWVAAMRGNILPLSESASADVYANESWPECPAEVAALVAEY
ncbi:hypothetical protein [Roseibium litorale]|uniref:Phage tail assembly chaperone n=1 Tax=Roseibium litorale TaxID=2803841 RepID=A0ABR9CJH8_9HYPH|nr:hypothetical protein [Roseibium litorale]MBD8890893.1 hypothetical protein [Roseibium litorale]